MYGIIKVIFALLQTHVYYFLRYLFCIKMIIITFPTKMSRSQNRNICFTGLICIIIISESMNKALIKNAYCI